MADTKISALPTATTIAGTETLPVVQAGATAQVTVTNLLAPSLALLTPKLRVFNAQVGTTYTLALTDASVLVTFGSGSATTVTIPTEASVAFPIGTQIDFIQVGAGKVTFAGDVGVTLNSQGSRKAIAAQNVGVTLVKTATDTWYLLGSLIA